jgi:hypothetical protein
VRMIGVTGALGGGGHIAEMIGVTGGRGLGPNHLAGGGGDQIVETIGREGDQTAETGVRARSGESRTAETKDIRSQPS